MIILLRQNNLILAGDCHDIAWQCLAMTKYFYSSIELSMDSRFAAQQQMRLVGNDNIGTTQSSKCDWSGMTTGDLIPAFIAEDCHDIAWQCLAMTEYFWNDNLRHGAIARQC